MPLPFPICFRIDEAPPKLQEVGAPSMHLLSLWMNKGAAKALAHQLLEAAVGIPPSDDGVGQIQLTGWKMRQNYRLEMDVADDSPMKVSQIVSPEGDPIILKRKDEEPAPEAKGAE